jgi:translocation and assembly module TamA
MQYVRESIDYRLTIPEEEGLRTFLDPDDGDLPLQNFNNSLALGIDYDMPLIRGEGFETVGFHHRAWAFTSNQAWGSDEDFTQLYAASRWNFIVGRRWKFLLRGEVGYSNADVNRLVVDIEDREINLSVTDLPNIYRFKAGGSTSVRGYGFESLSNNGIGSNNIITASAEVEMRVLPKWSVAAFYDFGNAFNDWDDIEMRRSPGIGIRWYTIAGAIRVDLAKGLDLPDQPWRFNFTIGISLL